MFFSNISYVFLVINSITKRPSPLLILSVCPLLILSPLVQFFGFASNHAL